MCSVTTNGWFVAGTSASAVHFQAYLVEGLVRWNAARARAALQGREGGGGGVDGSRSREGEGHLSSLQWLDVRQPDGADTAQTRTTAARLPPATPVHR